MVFPQRTSPPCSRGAHARVRLWCLFRSVQPTDPLLSRMAVFSRVSFFLSPHLFSSRALRPECRRLLVYAHCLPSPLFTLLPLPFRPGRHPFLPLFPHDSLTRPASCSLSSLVRAPTSWTALGCQPCGPASLSFSLSRAFPSPFPCAVGPRLPAATTIAPRAPFRRLRTIACDTHRSPSDSFVRASLPRPSPLPSLGLWSLNAPALSSPSDIRLLSRAREPRSQVAGKGTRAEDRGGRCVSIGPVGLRASRRPPRCAMRYRTELCSGERRVRSVTSPPPQAPGGPQS